jgi:hypothetical protein
VLGPHGLKSHRLFGTFVVFHRINFLVKSRERLAASAKASAGATMLTTMKCLSVAAATALMVSAAPSWAATVFANGDRIGVEDRYPNKDTIFRADGIYTVGASSPIRLGSGIYVDFSGSGFTLSPSNNVRYGDVDFNGPRLFDIDNNIADFSAVTLLSSTITGLDQTRISFDSNNIFLNLQGLTFTSGQTASFAVASLASAVPETATWSMMILGMGAVGFAMRRRKNVSTSVRFARV